MGLDRAARDLPPVGGEAWSAQRRKAIDLAFDLERPERKRRASRQARGGCCPAPHPPTHISDDDQKLQDDRHGVKDYFPILDEEEMMQDHQAKPAGVMQVPK